jgi:hypothetical protein
MSTEALPPSHACCVDTMETRSWHLLLACRGLASADVGQSLTSRCGGTFVCLAGAGDSAGQLAVLVQPLGDGPLSVRQRPHQGHPDRCVLLKRRESEPATNKWQSTSSCLVDCLLAAASPALGCPTTVGRGQGTAMPTGCGGGCQWILCHGLNSRSTHAPHTTSWCARAMWQGVCFRRHHSVQCVAACVDVRTGTQT